MQYTVITFSVMLLMGCLTDYIYSLVAFIFSVFAPIYCFLSPSHSSAQSPVDRAIGGGWSPAVKCILGRIITSMGISLRQTALEHRQRASWSAMLGPAFRKRPGGSACGDRWGLFKKSLPNPIKLCFVFESQRSGKNGSHTPDSYCTLCYISYLDKMLKLDVFFSFC